jgi:type IV fimbrial biogenesis protein FimT
MASQHQLFYLKEEIMKNKGFSLIEALAVLAIVGITTSIAVPQLSDLVNRNKVDTQLLSLRQLFAVARQKAIDNNSAVTLCSSSDMVHCADLWSHSIIVFSDQNKNAIVDESDVVWVAADVFDEMQPLLKQPINKTYFRFTAQGYTHGTPGNIVFCGSSRQQASARQLILSMAGRARISSDQDNDGLHEDSSGKALLCPS